MNRAISISLMVLLTSCTSASELNGLVSSYREGYSLLSINDIDKISCKNYGDIQTQVALDLNLDGKNDYGVLLKNGVGKKVHFKGEALDKIKLDFVVFLSTEDGKFERVLIEQFDTYRPVNIMLTTKGKGILKFNRIFCERSDVEIFWLNDELHTKYLFE